MVWSVALLALLGCQNEAEFDSTKEPVDTYDPLEYVDPFIATGGLGAEIAAVNPGATVPFGMTLVSPDTWGDLGDVVFMHYAGYHHADTKLTGFSHTHAHGMGIVDYGTILVMPRASWSPKHTRDATRLAPFSHENEWATPGYYAVELADDHTLVEIAATARGAHHRITFDDPDQPVLVFDLEHAIADNRVDHGEIEIDLKKGTVEGFQNLLGSYSDRFGGLQTSFSAVLDPAPVASGTWTDPDSPTEGASTASGPVAGGWVVFPKGTQTVDLRLAISYTDRQGARKNRQREMPDLDFDARRREAEGEWREALSNVRVRGGDHAQKRIFHTALYHSYIMPSVNADVDGRYRAFDDTIKTVDFPYYSDFSLWDTFRTLHPWYVLAQPERQQDMVRSLIRMTEDGGSVPRWPLGHGYTSGMVGTPADQVFAGTWLKGLQDWDPEWIFEMSVDHARDSQPDAGRAGIHDYVDGGYVAIESAGASSSRTLEFAWNDHALARWAEALGHDADARMLADQANNWKNVWDEDQGFFVGRFKDGSFRPLKDAFFWEDIYTEGNAHHYRWFVPFDAMGMVDVQHGGDVDAFIDTYDSYWAAVYEEPDDLLPDDYYWHGNEPDIHYAFLGSMVGRPDSTAEASRWVAANRYWDQPRGLDGNDDGGTLSAWYLFAASGFFPIAGTDEYVLGSPIFERIEIDQPDGSTIVVRAPGVSDEAMYLKSATLAGEKLTAPSFTHDQLMAGELVLEMTDEKGSWR